MDEQDQINRKTFPISQKVPAGIKLRKIFFFKHINKILLCLNLVVGILFIYLFLAKPYEVNGNPIAVLATSKYVFTDKISYLFNEPEIGDRIIFVPDEYENNYIGIILNKETSGDEKTYQVISSNERLPWTIKRKNILAKIYYPFVSETKEKETIKALLKEPMLSPTPTSTTNQKTPLTPAPTNARPLTTTPIAKMSPTPIRNLQSSGIGDIAVAYINSEGNEFYPPNQIATLKNTLTGETKTYTSTPSFFAGQLSASTYQINVNGRSDYKIEYTISGSREGPFTEGQTASVNLRKGDITTVLFRYSPVNKASADTGAPEVHSYSGPSDFTVTTSSDICITLTATDNVTPSDKLQMHLYLGKGPSMGTGDSTVATRENTPGLSHCFNGLANGFYGLRYFVKDEAGNSSSNRIVSFEVRR